ncbi:MAG TPA: hypothetical protein ENI94_06595 [Gammaproteobacteria bacterium]|nr:hypothetical protein [Gammaproteobacteria bacterium]
MSTEVRIIVGSHAWEYAKIDQSRPRLLLPPNASPDAYSWPVGNLECLVVIAGDISDSTLLQLARILLISGSPVVRILGREGSLSVFRPGDDQ